MSDQAALGDDVHVSAVEARRICGGLSEMSFWRYLKDPKYVRLGFPRPIWIANRRYWRLGDLRDWLASRKEAA